MKLTSTIFIIFICTGCAHIGNRVDVPSHWRFETDEFSLGLQLIDEKNCLGYAVHHKRDGVGSSCVYRVRGNNYYVMAVKSDGTHHEPQLYKFVPDQRMFTLKVKDGSQSFTFELSEVEE